MYLFSIPSVAERGGSCLPGAFPKAAGGAYLWCGNPSETPAGVLLLFTVDDFLQHGDDLVDAVSLL